MIFLWCGNFAVCCFGGFSRYIRHAAMLDELAAGCCASCSLSDSELRYWMRGWWLPLSLIPQQGIPPLYAPGKRGNAIPFTPAT
jgi:hypothetical protein